MASLARRLLRRSERNTLAQKIRLWLESSGSHRELLLQVFREQSSKLESNDDEEASVLGRYTE